MADNGIGNQLEGAAREIGGKIKNAAGALTGDTSAQIEGKANEIGRAHV